MGDARSFRTSPWGNRPCSHLPAALDSLGSSNATGSSICPPIRGTTAA